MAKLDRTLAALNKAAIRHARWGLQRATPHASKMWDESKADLVEAARRHAEALVDHHTRRLVVLRDEARR